MKKIVCIFLLAWLPLFMSAASAASLQMTLANLSTDTQEKIAEVPPCHQHLESSKNHPNPANPVQNNQTHVCAACGFCVIASGFAHFSAQVLVQAFVSTAIQPVFFTINFHSQTYPPAIRPPMFLA